MRALHPREAAMVRQLFPALQRCLNGASRVSERKEELRDAMCRGDNVVRMESAKRAVDLASSVSAEADRVLREALVDWLQIADGDLVALLERSVEVLAGGKGAPQ